MTKAVIIGVCGALLTFGAFILPDAAIARAAGGHSMGAPGHAVAPFRHHRPRRVYPYLPYYGGYGYGYDYEPEIYAPASAPPPPAANSAAEKPAVESRRGCEPQNYTVPSASGGESQVTVLRC
jgi:hypothetical protein